MAEYTLKKTVNWFLCRTPSFYRFLIRFLKLRDHREKLVYLAYVRKGDHVIDIGANYGVISLLLSNITGARGKVYSYEAVKPTFDILSANIFTYRFYDNLQLYNYAVSDTREPVTIIVPGNDYGQASMKIHESGSWTENTANTVYTCSCIKLDDHLAHFEKVDFIKLDIEGAELPALKGAAEVIKKFRPVLYVEVFKNWTKEFGYHPMDLYNFIKESGYRRFFIKTPDGINALADPAIQLNQDYSADLICLPE